MKYTSVSKNKNAVIVATVFGVLTVILLVISMFDFFFRGVFEILAIASAITVIQIAQRYLMCYYEYILDPENELTSHNRLTVIQVVGKKKTSLFTVPLAYLKGVIPYKKMKAVEKEYGKIGKKMSFCPDIRPKESCLAIFEDGDELVLLRLQCDGEFMAELEERKGF